jgi:HAD superfamily hydrolase (TIGR01509 family)
MIKPSDVFYHSSYLLNPKMVQNCYPNCIIFPVIGAVPVINAVIFDMDGLLLDTEGTYLSFSREVAAEMGFPLEEEVFHRCIGIPHNKTTAIVREATGGKMDVEQWARGVHKKVFQFFSKEGVKIKAGAVPLLETLKSRGLPLAVASSTHREGVLQLLAGADLVDYFQYFSCGDEVKNSKPDPEIFLKAAGGLGIDPQDCLVFEDSPAGIRAAAAAGMRPVMVPDLIMPHPDFYEHIFRVCPSLVYAGTILEELLN